MPDLKISVTLSLEPNAWFAFRDACNQRGTKASAEVQAFMQKTLETWKTQEKETDHA